MAASSSALVAAIRTAAELDDMALPSDFESKKECYITGTKCMFMYEYQIVPSAEGPILAITPRVGALASTSGVKEFGKLLVELCPQKVIIKGDSPAYIPNPNFISGASGTKKRFGSDIRNTVLSMYCYNRLFSDVTACAIFDVTWANLSSSCSFMEAITARAMWPVTREEPVETNFTVTRAVEALKEAAAGLERSYSESGRTSRMGGVLSETIQRGEDCIPDREFYTLVKSCALNIELKEGQSSLTPHSLLSSLDDSLCIAESVLRKQGLLPDTEYPGPSAAAHMAEYSAINPPSFANNSSLQRLRQIGRGLAYKPDYIASSEFHSELRNARVDMQSDKELCGFLRSALTGQYTKRLDNVPMDRKRWLRTYLENIDNTAFTTITAHVYAAFADCAANIHVKDIELRDITCFQTPGNALDDLAERPTANTTQLRSFVVNNCSFSMHCLSNLAAYAGLKSVDVFELVDLPFCFIDGMFDKELVDCVKYMGVRHVNVRHTHSAAQETLMLLEELPISISNELLSMDKLGRAKEVYVRFVAQHVAIVNYIQLRYANAAAVELLNATLRFPYNQGVETPCLRQYEHLHCNLLPFEKLALRTVGDSVRAWGTFGLSLQDEVARQANEAAQTRVVSSSVRMLPPVLQRVDVLYDEVAPALPPVFKPVAIEPNVYWGKYDITRPYLEEDNKYSEKCRRIYAVEVVFSDEEGLLVTYGATYVGTSPITGDKFVGIQVRVYTSDIVQMPTLTDLLGDEVAQQVIAGAADVEVTFVDVHAGLVFTEGTENSRRQCSREVQILESYIFHARSISVLCTNKFTEKRTPSHRGAEYVLWLVSCYCRHHLDRLHVECPHAATVGICECPYGMCPMKDFMDKDFNDAFANVALDTIQCRIAGSFRISWMLDFAGRALTKHACMALNDITTTHVVDETVRLLSYAPITHHDLRTNHLGLTDPLAVQQFVCSSPRVKSWGLLDIVLRRCRNSSSVLLYPLFELSMGAVLCEKEVPRAHFLFADVLDVMGPTESHIIYNYREDFAAAHCRIKPLDVSSLLVMKSTWGVRNTRCISPNGQSFHDIANRIESGDETCLMRYGHPQSSAPSMMVQDVAKRATYECRSATRFYDEDNCAKKSGGSGAVSCTATSGGIRRMSTGSSSSSSSSSSSDDEVMDEEEIRVGRVKRRIESCLEQVGQYKRLRVSSIVSGDSDSDEIAAAMEEEVENVYVEEPESDTEMGGETTTCLSRSSTYAELISPFAADDKSASESVTVVAAADAAEPTPAEPTPAEPTPAEPTPAEPTPADAAEPTPAEPTPAEPTPADAAEPTPAEPTPADAAEPTPSEPVVAADAAEPDCANEQMLPRVIPTEPSASEEPVAKEGPVFVWPDPAEPAEVRTLSEKEFACDTGSETESAAKPAVAAVKPMLSNEEAARQRKTKNAKRRRAARKERRTRQQAMREEVEFKRACLLNYEKVSNEVFEGVDSRSRECFYKESLHERRGDSLTSVEYADMLSTMKSKFPYQDMLLEIKREQRESEQVEHETVEKAKPLPEKEAVETIVLSDG